MFPSSNYIGIEDQNFFRKLKNALPAQPIAKEIKCLEDICWNSIGMDVITGTLDIPSADARFEVNGTECTIPLAEDTAEFLYHTFDPSLVGVEGEGDISDSSLRLSVEYSITEATSLHTFSSSLMKLNFEGILDHIKEKLCPSAEKVAARPYKLLLYQEGDFFTAHRDSMSHPLQFGSLAIQVPLTMNPPQEAEDLEEEPDICSSHSTPDGNLIFYVGRDVGSIYGGSQKAELMRNVAWATYGRCTKDDEQFVYRVDLTSSLPQKEGFASVKYAAWVGDVPHEVTRVRDKFRVVLLYRLFKKGHNVQYIPRPLRSSILDSVERLFSLIPVGKAFDYLGIILRHCYPPAGLVPSGLKGVDAMMHNILAPQYECFLHNGIEVRCDYPSTPFRIHSRDEAANYPPHVRQVFCTTERFERAADLSRERAQQDLMANHEVFNNCFWMQLGLGSLIGGGSSYGNADCGANWWYRNAVLIASRRPGKWARCRPLFLAAIHGGQQSEGLRRLYKIEELFEKVCGFL